VLELNVVMVGVGAWYLWLDHRLPEAPGCELETALIR
jgi:hypothetical protein